ncbi:hypothetical protein A3715_15510 [Oleiphilus sp. HI0009]|nr:hypothetical protein A3715_15510 [Oleiphilus sp. HI0009]
MQVVAPAYIGDINRVWYTVGAIIVVIFTVQLGGIPFVRSQLGRLIKEGDKATYRLNKGKNYNDKIFIVMEGKIKKINKELPPENYDGYFLDEKEKHNIAEVENEDEIHKIPLEFIAKIA